MNWKIPGFLLSFVLLILNGNSQDLTIAAASNSRDAIEDICEAFQKETNYKVNAVFASSGKITNQVSNGAPYHVFISANLLYPEKLYENGFALTKPKPVIRGSLIIYCKQKNKLQNYKELLLHDEIKTIAIANPQIAPFGKAAAEVLKNLGIYKEIKPKLIITESVAQVNQHLFLNSVDAGITSKSYIYSVDNIEAENWQEIDTSLYNPIYQYVVLLKTKKEKQEQVAKRFIAYLYSDKAKSIYEKYGYYNIIPENE